MTAHAGRVPCTIVTGFLGAGKTTLIRHVLQNVDGRRLAVIVNEFGDVGIDGEILKGCGDAALEHDNPIEEVFDDQVACADLVVLNKSDLVDAAGLDAALAALGKALPRGVKIIRATEGKVAPAALLGLGIGAEDHIAARRTRHDAEPEHDHDDFDSFVLPIGEIAEPAELARRVAPAAAGADVLRVKGFAAVAGKPMRLLLQAVGPRVTHHYDRAWGAAEPRQGRLVVIGLKGLDRAAVARALNG